MNYLINRLKEASTWRGIILVVAGVFVTRCLPAFRKRLLLAELHWLVLLVR
jgi:hypothetical protein